MTTCRSCDAEVVFVPSAKSGKAMILDAKPRKGVVLDVAEILPDVAEPRVYARVADVYTDHHATCPDAKDWR